MKVKELIEKLNKCVPEAEIGFEDLGGVYEIKGVGLTLYGDKGIEGMIYTLSSADEMDEVTEISNSINQKIGKNYITELQSQNRDLIGVIKNSIETLKDIKGFTGKREDKNNLIKCVINDLEKVREAD